MILITFFIITFIAEIIVTFKIVEYLRNLDKKVCYNNLRLENFRNSLAGNLCKVRIKINTLHLKINEKLLKIASKKAAIKQKILKHFISSIIILFFKSYKRKILYWLELIFALIDLSNIWKRSNIKKKQIYP